jgi:hypothetical protein
MSNTFEAMHEQVEIANLYYCKSRAMTLTKLEKMPHAKSKVHSFTVMLIIIPVI